VPTTAVRDELRALQFSNLEVLGRGVDSRLFNPERRSAGLRALWGARPDAPVVLYVSRLASEKSPELALAAFEAIARREPAARMVVVGSGPMYPKLAESAPDVIFTGAKKGEDLATHYASADIFLFPSETETFGNVTLEAMASGLAVLAFDRAAAGQLIEPGVNGQLVRPGDHRGFRAAAAGMLDADIKGLGERARETALSHDWERVIDQFETLLYRCSRGEHHGNGK
jgi:glycosyltransferase involved in cell wall biosynthesis